MLRHELASDGAEATASSEIGRNYTDQEFAAAVTAIEARRLQRETAEAQISADRRTLAEVGAAATHQEVLAEIMRTRESAKAHGIAVHTNLRRRLTRGIAVATAVLAIGFGTVLLITPHVSRVSVPETSSVEVDSSHTVSTEYAPGAPSRWLLKPDALVLTTSGGTPE